VRLRGAANFFSNANRRHFLYILIFSCVYVHVYASPLVMKYLREIPVMHVALLEFRGNFPGNSEELCSSSVMPKETFPQYSDIFTYIYTYIHVSTGYRVA